MTDTIQITCPNCRGAGEVSSRHPSGNQQLETQVSCPECNGTGETETESSEVDALVDAVFVALDNRATPYPVRRALEKAMIGMGRSA